MSGNVAEIYGDLIEIRGYIEKLEKGWDPLVYDHFQDLIEYHTTHHIVLLLRAVQSLIGKAV